MRPALTLELATRAELVNRHLDGSIGQKRTSYGSKSGSHPCCATSFARWQLVRRSRPSLCSRRQPRASSRFIRRWAARALQETSKIRVGQIRYGGRNSQWASVHKRATSSAGRRSPCLHSNADRLDRHGRAAPEQPRTIRNVWVRADISRRNSDSRQRPSAYVFKRNSSGVWTQRQRGITSGPRWYEDGTLAIVASDAVNIYQLDAAGKLTLRQKLVSPDSAPNDRLGGLSMAGPTMVMGGNGRAYVFRRNSTGVWRHRQTLIASELGTEEGARAGFGGTVAIDRGMIIVGAPALADRKDRCLRKERRMDSSLTAVATSRLSSCSRGWTGMAIALFRSVSR